MTPIYCDECGRDVPRKDWSVAIAGIALVRLGSVLARVTVMRHKGYRHCVAVLVQV